MSNIKPTKTIVYKKVDNLEIALDLYLPSGAKNVPVLIWFHGGGLLQGNRELLAPHFRQGVQRHEFACVAADYRLAPQTGIEEILQDVLDCIHFVRTQLSSYSAAGALNVQRLAVAGNSAGGYLTLLAGLYADPKPNVILPLEPITDPLGSFFTTSQPIPSEYYLASHEELAVYLDPKAMPVSRSGWVGEDPRANMYVRMLKDANLAELLHLPQGAAASKFRVSQQVYTQRLPPAYFLHGASDIDVGISQSDIVVGAIVGCGLEVEYERVPGEKHYLANGEDYENDAMYSFLMKYL